MDVLRASLRKERHEAERIAIKYYRSHIHALGYHNDKLQI